LRPAKEDNVMSFDIRMPIGVLFLALGLLLCLYGLNSDPAIYRTHSLGENINLLWGAVMAVFGAIMLGLTLVRGRPKA
jgi:hypothetical protein